MRKTCLAFLLALPLLAHAAADDVKKDATAKPSTKLGACSKEAHAKGLKGDERKKYVSACLAKAKAAKAQTPAAASG